MKFLSLLSILILIVFLASCETPNTVENPTDNNFTLQKGGFDEFGYNYNARIFNGLADGVDRNLDGTYWGNTDYANDKLNMKWSEAWDLGNAEGWTGEYPTAWTTNHWNGKMKDGSGEIWYYKIIWVGTELENSEYWRDGGYPIWGQFEVIFSHGTVGNEHFWDVHATPTGLISH
jgi:hypothetical protein